MAEQLKKRSEVPVELTWDLTALYKTEEDMFADMDKAKALCDSIVEKYQGKLTSPEVINACYLDYEVGQNYHSCESLWRACLFGGLQRRKTSGTQWQNYGRACSHGK